MAIRIKQTEDRKAFFNNFTEPFRVIIYVTDDKNTYYLKGKAYKRLTGYQVKLNKASKQLINRDGLNFDVYGVYFTQDYQRYFEVE